MTPPGESVEGQWHRVPPGATALWGNSRPGTHSRARFGAVGRRQPGHAPVTGGRRHG